jgi:hypothetical protein
MRCNEATLFCRPYWHRQPTPTICQHHPTKSNNNCKPPPPPTTTIIITKLYIVGNWRVDARMPTLFGVQQRSASRRFVQQLRSTYAAAQCKLVGCCCKRLYCCCCCCCCTLAILKLSLHLSMMLLEERRARPARDKLVSDRRRCRLQPHCPISY